MKILLLGVGMQGKAALYDLMRSPGVSEVVAADRDYPSLEKYARSQGYGDRVSCQYFDAADQESLERLMTFGADVVIDLLPAPFGAKIAKAALKHGVHLVYTSYATPEIKDLHNQAVAKGVTILPEFGLDPGIDLVLSGEAVRTLDEVTAYTSYGAGIPEAAAADNAIQYKVTWTFEGVLKAYYRPARVIRAGEIVMIPAAEIFSPHHIFETTIGDLGQLETFANGDALEFIQPLGLDQDKLQEMGRYTLRWPGHCAFWRAVASLHLLDDEPVWIDGQAVDRKRFLANAIGPHIQLGERERDIALVRIEVAGIKAGKRVKLVYQVLERRDLASGMTGMSRTVGFTASIGAQMIAGGVIGKPGVLSPIHDIPYRLFVAELERRGIEVVCERILIDD